MSTNTKRPPCPKCKRLKIPYLYGRPEDQPTPKNDFFVMGCCIPESWEAYLIGDAASVEADHNNNTRTSWETVTQDCGRHKPPKCKTTCYNKRQYIYHLGYCI